MKDALIKMILAMFGLSIMTGCAQPEPLRDREPGVDGLVQGIFSLGPSEAGLVESELHDGKCVDGSLPKVEIDQRGLCATGPLYQTMESTWANADIVGVYVRLPWGSTHIAPGMAPTSFDFTTLDHEFEQAVKYSKFISISWSAGKGDIPSWIFNEGEVTPYEFQDGGSNLAKNACGIPMTLGDPTDELYQKHYFDLLRGVGAHLNAHPEWMDRIAYVKLSGANLTTNEIRLPNRCEPGCDICNTEVWAKAGYTPEGFYGFILSQMAVLQEVFPGKPMVYQLIQDGLPWINDQGDYLQADGTSSGAPVTRSVTQVEEIIRRGSALYGSLFVVAHNGLQPARIHAPNRWVVDAGQAGQPTAFQTMNLVSVNTPGDLQASLENMWQNTDSAYLEAYEEVLWLAAQDGNKLVPDNRAEVNTLAEWNDLLQREE